MKTRNSFFEHVFALMLIGGLASSTALAGPIILGGDDLDYHGNYNNGAGPNQKGWLYIQKALANMYKTDPVPCITRPGNDGSIAVLGCPLSVLPNGTSNANGHAGAAIHFAGNVALGKVVNYYDLAAGINQFFVDLASGTVNPAIIYIPSSNGDAVDGIDPSEGAALTAHAIDLKNFVNSGGGLMAHIDGPNTSGWVTAVTGVTVNLGGCNSTGAALTSTGSTAFPSLSNSDIDGTAGPCHATFSGTLGGLSVLALDGAKKNLIIGGGCDTAIGITPTPTPTPCAEVKDDIRCLPNGDYSYTFTVKNNSSVDASQILLTPLPGSTFTLSPQLTNLGSALHNGQSTTVTTNISNVKPGDKVCFFVSLMSDKTQCCIVQVCITLPSCGVSETPTPTPPAIPRQVPRGKRRP